MEQSRTLNFRFHLRMLSLISLLFIVDITQIFHALKQVLLKGPSMMIMFGFEVI